MSTGSFGRLDFGNRYALESISGGEGILIDLQTGSYFKINTTAALICRAFEDASNFNGAIDQIAKGLRVSSEEAQRLAALINDGLAVGPAPEIRPGPLRYVSGADGSATFEEDGHPIFFISSANRTLHFRASLRDLTGPLVLYVQALVPKLLALLEIPVLHAAACHVTGNLVAFSGRSGAGKTTTARAFARAGAQLMSEDLVILSSANDFPCMYNVGEKLARDWARGVASSLETSPQDGIDFSPLAYAQQGATMPIDSIWFVDVKRRGGEDIELRVLSTADGALELIGNGLLATSQPAHWRNLLRRSCRIAERTRLSEATMPEGVGRLEAATKRYIVNSAS